MDLDAILQLLLQRRFVEAAYFGSVAAGKTPTAVAHMLTGVACCGCVEPFAIGQRLLEGVPVPDDRRAAVLISFASELPYEGFFRLVEAVRIDPTIEIPERLREIANAVADDLAFFSRREIHRPPEARRRYSLCTASLSAAVLLRRLTASERELPGVMASRLEYSAEVLRELSSQTGGDATFY